MDNPLMLWGKKYIALGWSIIPVSSKGKEPLIPWGEFQQRCANHTELETWFTKWPNMNLGVVTGAISHLVVVDADGSEGLKSLVQGRLTSSVIALTGKGKQVFYKWTEPVGNSVKKLAPGVDIRGDGGFVVVPPSIHSNGKIYRWEKFIPAHLTIMPKLLPEPEVPIGKNKDLKYSEKPNSWIAEALEAMKNGNRDNTLFTICSRLRDDGYSEKDAFVLLSPHADRVGALGILEAKITNVWSRYEPSVRESIQSPRYLEQNSRLHIHSPANGDSYEKFRRFADNHMDIRGNLSTGFPTLDKMLEGGLKSERLFTLAARTGTGKTNWAISLARALCEQGKKVLFFSTEFRYEKIWQRYIATCPEPGSFRTHPLYVCDSFTPAINQVEEAIKQVKPDVFIFDHITHISEDRETIGQFMQGCNFLQRKYNCQGIIVAQLNRQADWVENGKRVEPRMSMIKSSGTIEQASSRVLLLSEVRVTPEYNEILGVLDKNDSGDRGLINFGLYKSPYVLKELI